MWYLSHLLISLNMVYWPQFEIWQFVLKIALVPWNFCSSASLQFLYKSHKSSTSLQTKLYFVNTWTCVCKDSCVYNVCCEYTWTKCDSSVLETYMAIYHFSHLCIMQLICLSSMHMCMWYAYFIMDSLATKITDFCPYLLFILNFF